MEDERITVRITETGKTLELTVLSKRVDRIEVVIGEGVHSSRCALTPTRNALAYAGSVMGREIIYERVESRRAGRHRSSQSARPRRLAAWAPMIIVHHLNNSRSQRVLWLLEELGVALRDQALPARPQDDAGAAVAARGASARQVAGDHRRRARRSPSPARSSSTWSSATARDARAGARHARAAALHLLAALRRGLGDAAAAAQAGLRPRRRPRRCRSS